MAHNAILWHDFPFLQRIIAKAIKKQFYIQNFIITFEVQTEGTVGICQEVRKKYVPVNMTAFADFEQVNVSWDFGKIIQNIS